MEQIQGVVLGLFVGVGVVVALVIIFALVRSIWQICPPNQALIFSGRGSTSADGRKRGFRILFGGGSLRIPIIETVDRIPLSTIEVPIGIRNAYTKGGIALNVDAIANVKISSDPQIITNAIERFLGRDPSEIRRVAKETLEGHLRGVLARLTPEEVNEDRLKFADELSTESEQDLSKLGIHLDTLKILHVSDDQRYLDSIGREAIANIIKEAEITESDMKRAAELAEADNSARANVKRANVEAMIAQMRNDLRKIQADLESQVKSEEERTLAAAREARATAEQELQQIRAQLEEIRLKVDQVMPATADQTAKEFRARGEAAILRERGYAMSEALNMMNEAWSEAGDSAMSIYLIEDIEKILAVAARGVGKVKINSLNMIDGGDGEVLTSYVAAYPAMLNSVFQAIAQTTGIDIPKSISVNEEIVSKNGAAEVTS